MADTALLTTLVGIATGALGGFWTVRTYYLKRQDEQRDRQRAELERARVELDRQKAERQAELEKYADGKTREYASQRDFSHLLNQYKTLDLNLTTLHDFQGKQLADIELDLRDLKSMLNILLLQAGSTDTGIARYLKREE
ncbi:MAG: hypothetical protein H7Z11_15780 [Verrucomicrobia bacterium]|nr:hypothetical protein [Leptolyngbya sp. ES-bin-22]